MGTMESCIAFNCPDCRIKIKLKNIAAGDVAECGNCHCKIKFMDYGHSRLSFYKFGEVEREHQDKPPLGLTPKHIIDLQRVEDIRGAVNRYFAHNKAIPIEWIEEYNQIVTK